MQRNVDNLIYSLKIFWSKIWKISHTKKKKYLIKKVLISSCGQQRSCIIFMYPFTQKWHLSAFEVILYQSTVTRMSLKCNSFLRLSQKLAFTKTSKVTASKESKSERVENMTFWFSESIIFEFDAIFCQNKCLTILGQYQDRY